MKWRIASKKKQRGRGERLLRNTGREENKQKLLIYILSKIKPYMHESGTRYCVLKRNKKGRKGVREGRE